jgi:hypothetical protein
MCRLQWSRFETVSNLAFLFQVFKAVPSWGDAVFRCEIHESRHGRLFVDVGVYLHNGERAMNRTLVIKDRDGKWYVHPDPSASPLLSDGLNEEKASVEDLTDAYELARTLQTRLSVYEGME